MSTDELIAFVATAEPEALEIRVNFGVFAGREATAAELDELAHALRPAVGEMRRDYRPIDAPATSTGPRTRNASSTSANCRS